MSEHDNEGMEFSDDAIWVEVEGGDEVLIDLGGFGIAVWLDDDEQWYDEEYVGIEYDENGDPDPYMIPADVYVLDKDGKEHKIEQAQRVRIYRHRGPKETSEEESGK